MTRADNLLSSLSISTVRLLAATISLYSGSASTGPDTRRIVQKSYFVVLKFFENNQWGEKTHNNSQTHPLSSCVVFQYNPIFCP